MECSNIQKEYGGKLPFYFYTNGYDIDVTMVRLGLMNLMMHGVDNPHVDYKDTLGKEFNEEGLYDIIMANPPFKRFITAILICVENLH